MLTSDLSIVRYEKGQAIPDRLTRGTHAHYLDYAAKMIAVYRSGAGLTRRQLHRSVEAILSSEPDCPRQRIASFCKLLDDAAEFDVDRRGRAAALRLKVFSLAAQFHPLVTTPDGIFERGLIEAQSRIAAEVGKSWEQIDAALYTDVLDRQPLAAFNGFPSPEALLSAYNLAQLQACLYRATRLTVEAAADFAAIVRHARLARLLMETSCVSPGRYRIELSGPASILHETRRYGVNASRFLAALVACRDWSLQATMTTPWNTPARLKLSSRDGFSTHIAAPATFDSSVEEALARKWGDLRDGWRLIRDAGILQHGQTTFVPDFLLRHTDGREVFLEIVGFWTPEYLQAKRHTIARFADRRILLAVPRRTAKIDESGPGVVLYKTRIKPEQIVAAAAALCPALPPR
jgi:uncharacterized protein